MKIMVDAGHRNNGNDFGASGNGLRESAIALSISKKVKAELEQHNIIVYMSRESESDIISLENRTTKANNLKVDLYVSIHCNAYNGQKRGIECLYYTDDSLAKDMCNRMCKSTNARNRGAKQRKDLHVLKSTKMDAILVECGFIDHPEEGKLLADENYQDKLAKGIVGAIINKYKIVVEEPIQKGTPIIGPATATVEQCKEWATSKGAKQTFIDNADIYFEVCKQVGINPVMAYVQYALESGYGHHKGTVPESYHNPCGLKIAEGGSDTDKNAHKEFRTWKDGISAHVDHIALYVGVNGYPKVDTQDPRHFSYLFGKYKTVEAIGKGWCPSNPKYGDTLIQFMNEIETVKVQDKDEYQDAVEVLHEEGIMVSPEAWRDKQKISTQFVPGLMINMAKYIRGKS